MKLSVAVLFLAALVVVVTAMPSGPAGVDNSLDVMEPEDFKAELIENHCDDERCNEYCKTRPGYTGGSCNHYQLCSCHY